MTLKKPLSSWKMHGDNETGTKHSGRQNPKMCPQNSDPHSTPTFSLWFNLGAAGRTCRGNYYPKSVDFNIGRFSGWAWPQQVGTKQWDSSWWKRLKAREIRSMRGILLAGLNEPPFYELNASKEMEASACHTWDYILLTATQTWRRSDASDEKAAFISTWWNAEQRTPYAMHGCMTYRTAS